MTPHRPLASSLCRLAVVVSCLSAPILAQGFGGGGGWCNPCIGAKATSQYVSGGCGSPFFPFLTVSPPVPGGNLHISVISSLPNAMIMIYATLSPPTAPITMPGTPCVVRLDEDDPTLFLVVSSMTSANGSYSTTIPIPETVTKGSIATVQAVVWAAPGDQISNAAKVKVGCPPNSCLWLLHFLCSHDWWNACGATGYVPAVGQIGNPTGMFATGSIWEE
jgi:hypothetical protein